MQEIAEHLGNTSVNGPDWQKMQREGKILLVYLQVASNRQWQHGTKDRYLEKEMTKGDN